MCTLETLPLNTPEARWHLIVGVFHVGMAKLSVTIRSLLIVKLIASAV